MPNTLTSLINLVTYNQYTGNLAVGLDITLFAERYRFFTFCKKRRCVTKLFAPISETFVVGKIVCVCFVLYGWCSGFCENRFGVGAANIKSSGA